MAARTANSAFDGCVDERLAAGMLLTDFVGCQRVRQEPRASNCTKAGVKVLPLGLVQVTQRYKGPGART